MLLVKFDEEKFNGRVEMTSIYGVLRCAAYLFKILKGVDSLSKEMDDEEKKIL
jgi:hypothetical protein